MMKWTKIPKLDMYTGFGKLNKKWGLENEARAFFVTDFMRFIVVFPFDFSFSLVCKYMECYTLIKPSLLWYHIWIVSYV